MKPTVLLSFIFLLILNFSFGQDKIFNSKEFKWSISIPKECSVVKSDDWLEEINKENLKNGQKFETEENSKIVVVLKIDSLNYFVVYNSINLSKSNALENLNKFMELMASKGAKSGETNNKENKKIMISNIEFNVMKFNYIFPGATFVNTEIYGAFIKKNKIFTSLLVYNDIEKGKILINSFKESTFK